jgi:hypothetical protein
MILPSSARVAGCVPGPYLNGATQRGEIFAEQAALHADRDRLAGRSGHHVSVQWMIRRGRMSRPGHLAFMSIGYVLPAA